jgi:hypothetical protein
VGLALELDPRQLPIDQAEREQAFSEVADAVRDAVATEHGIVLSLIAIVGVGGVPKTSSGKLRRSACRDALLDSLGGALQHSSDTQLYPDGPCQLGMDQHQASAQECADSINYRAVGAITQPRMPWVNRPTFQQAVHIK